MHDDLADTYRRFADVEAHGSSATYADWARSIAGDDVVLERIGGLPRPKRRPTLVFAAARWCGAPVGPYGPFRDWLVRNWADIVPVILARATQTNEAARCAVLLPVLSRLPGPLALIEVGASAGLCLCPDRYSYRYDTGVSVVGLDPPDGPSDVVLPCAIDAASVPTAIPEVAWRAGVDLQPLDVRRPEDVAWLEALIWPEHEDRRRRLHAAASLAAQDPPQLVRGDLLESLPGLIDRAPAGAHVVVFHTAVLVYLDEARRRSVAGLLRARPEVTWVSNEGADVLPEVTARVGAPVGRDFVVAVDGRPAGLAEPHGRGFAGLDPAGTGRRDQ